MSKVAKKHRVVVNVNIQSETEGEVLALGYGSSVVVLGKTVEELQGIILAFEEMTRGYDRFGEIQ